MGYSEICYEVDEQIATITLNRPERLNAATFDMGEQLCDAVAAADRDTSVRVLILTGAGRAFCSGDDVEAAWGDPRMQEAMRELSDVRPPVTPEIVALLSCSKPVIAAVNGPAIGIGMDLALACDVLVAAESTKFGQLFVRMGLMADVMGLWRLPQLVGPSMAAELLLTGDTVDSDTALRIGLVSRVVPDSELLQSARKLAARIAANPPLALRYIKEGLRRARGRSDGDLGDMGAFIGAGLARLFKSEDHKEAAAAFLEKRPANFTGR